MPDESKVGLKPGRSWFEIIPTYPPVFVTEGPGRIFQKHRFLDIFSGISIYARPYHDPRSSGRESAPFF
jgi:hypothetical protein